MVWGIYLRLIQITEYRFFQFYSKILSLNQYSTLNVLYILILLLPMLCYVMLCSVVKQYSCKLQCFLVLCCNQYVVR